MKNMYLYVLGLLVVVVVSEILLLYFWTEGLRYIRCKQYIDSEKRMVTEWANSYIDKPSVLYVIEPWIYRRYSINKYVDYPDIDKSEKWVKNPCQQNKDVYIVIDNKIDTVGGYYEILHGLDTFKHIAKMIPLHKRLSLIHVVSIDSHWANIYKVDKNDQFWCSVLKNKK